MTDNLDSALRRAEADAVWATGTPAPVEPVLPRSDAQLPPELTRGADIPADLDPLAEGVLMLHQRQWLEDKSDLKICKKGRRTGITFAEALDDTLIAAAARSAGGDNVFYIGDTKDTRELDKTIADLKAKNKNGIFDKEIAQAEAAKLTVREALVRPLEEARQESERRLQVQSLMAAGMDAEAEALERIWRFEQQNYKMSAAQKQEVLDRVRYEREVSAELQRRRGLIEGYLDTTRSIKQELTSIFSGTGSAGNLASIGRQLNSQMLVEKIFGSAFKDLDDWVKGQSGLKPSIDYFSEEAVRGGNAVGDFASAVTAAAMQVRSASMVRQGGGISEGLQGISREQFGEIVVQAPRDSVFALTPNEYFAKMGGTMAGTIVDALNKEFNTTFFSRFEGMLAGGIKGYLTAGPTGGVLGALQAIPGLPKGIADNLDKALGGAQTGSLVSGIASAFGIKMNSGGAQLGGALGGALSFIPGGSIIGSIAGGLLGNLFGKRPRGAGSVSNTGVTASANDAGITGSLNETGSNLQGAIAQIANALGASVGNYSIGIGRYKDYYQVSSAANDPRLGNSYFGRDSKSALYDGLDPAAAMRAAIAGAISQGAIEGLSDAMQKALRSSTDIDAAIKEALKVREVETLIGGIGKALEEQFKSFERQAAERLRIARQYGFDVAKIEELNARERAKLVKDLLADQVGSGAGSGTCQASRSTRPTTSIASPIRCGRSIRSPRCATRAPMRPR